MTESSDESPLKFPCEFPVKAMGLSGDDFEQHVMDIFRRHVSDLDETMVTRRDSQGGKYVSITVTIQAKIKTLQVHTKGQALENGRMGQRIKIKFIREENHHDEYKAHNTICPVYRFVLLRNRAGHGLYME